MDNFAVFLSVLIFPITLQRRRKSCNTDGSSAGICLYLYNLPLINSTSLSLSLSHISLLSFSSLSLSPPPASSSLLRQGMSLLFSTVLKVVLLAVTLAAYSKYGDNAPLLFHHTVYASVVFLCASLMMDGPAGGWKRCQVFSFEFVLFFLKRYVQIGY